MLRPCAALPLGLLLLTGGCLSTDPSSGGLPLDFEFTVPDGAAGWQLGAADYAVGSEATVDIVGDQRALPAEVSTQFLGLYQSGTNVGSDLFIFYKKFLTAPPGTYKVTALVQFVSNAHGECSSGVGVDVVMKAGASAVEPIAAPDGQNVYRMNIDKGTQTTGGDFIQLPDIRNGLAGCPAVGTFGARTTALFPQQEDLVVGDAGGFWAFFATQSSFAGRHEIYFTHLRLVLLKL